MQQMFWPGYFKLLENKTRIGFRNIVYATDCRKLAIYFAL